MASFPDGPWSVAEGIYDNRPLIVRINAGASSLRGAPSLRHRVGVAVPLNMPGVDGLPSAAEAAILADIEDALTTALKTGSDAVQLLVITTSGMREFVFHTTVPAGVGTAVTEVASRFPSHELQCIQEEDPDWEVYSQFTE